MKKLTPAADKLGRALMDESHHTDTIALDDPDLLEVMRWLVPSCNGVKAYTDWQEKRA